MADFFSRIFAIPSDVSSVYSPDSIRGDNNAANAATTNGGANAAALSGSGGRKKNKKGHSRTLTPLSLTDGNGTLTSQSFGEGTLSYGSEQSPGDENDDDGTGTLEEEDEEGSTSSETMEEHGGGEHLLERFVGAVVGTADDDDDDDDDDNNKGRSRFASTTPTSRGRQHKSDKPAHRSASERPTMTRSENRLDDKKKYRSSSVAISQGRRTRSTNMNVPTRNNMSLQLNSPTKKSQKDQKIRNGRRHRSSAVTRGELECINSWSSGEEEEEEEEEAKSQRRRARSASVHRRTDRKNSNSTSGQRSKRHDSETLNSSNHSSTRTDRTTNKTTTTTTKEKEKASKKKEKKERGRSSGWRSKFAGGMKKHLSPGTTISSTPPQPKSNKGRGSSNSKKKYQNKATTPTEPAPRPQDDKKIENTNKEHPRMPRGGGDGKLNLPISAHQQPINVGDHIVISQQFLEECGDMSVLTMPRELAAMNEERAGLAEEFDKTIQEVGQRTVMENDRVQAFLDARRGQGDDFISPNSTGISTVNNNNGRGMIYEKIGAYASRVLEEGGNNGLRNGIHQSYSQESYRHSNDHNPPSQAIVYQGMDGIEAHRYSPGVPTNDAGVPPPPPPPHPRLSKPKSPRNNNVAQLEDLPHYNTPNNANSDSVATSYNDPPGTLVTSPTLLSPYDADRKSNNDPPGDSYDPFEESYGAMDRRHEVALQAEQVTGQKIRREHSNTGSGNGSKAVTFSLPPPTSASMSPPSAPPFMGPPSDHYYSMERHSGDNNPLPSFSTALLLPPIIELWSSVECAENVPGDIGGGTIAAACNGGRWDVKRENALLGEIRPLHVSNGWIDVHDEVEEDTISIEGEGLLEPTLVLTPDEGRLEPALVLTPDEGRFDPTLVLTPDTDGNAMVEHVLISSCIEEKSMVRKLSSSTDVASAGAASWAEGGASHHVHVAEEPHPDDEYFDDILDCTSPVRNVSGGKEHSQHEQQQNQDAGMEKIQPPSIPGYDCREDEDANVRHRSTWNSAYKPPKLCPFEDELSHAQNSHDTINWQKNVRARNDATVLIQKCMRGTLVRQRLHLLLDAVLILQPAIRTFLVRKRYLDYLKLKRSYFPGRWERSQMTVAI